MKRALGSPLTLAGFLLAPPALVAVSTAFAADLAPEEITTTAFNARWGAWGEIGGFYGTDESSYGDLIVFAPLWQSPDSLVFTEIRGKYFEGDLLEGNAAIGYRQMLASGWNLGAWVGLDVRYTESENTFGQVSGGLEALSEFFDARVNGYLPFTDPQTADDGQAEVVLEGSNIFMIGGEEVALYGVDGEIGGRLPLGGGNAATLGGYVGAFWFDHEDAVEAITGGKARVELAFNDVVGAGSRFSVQYEFTHDNVRDDRHLIGARLRIPLGAAPRASEVPAQWIRMADRLERDTNIVIGQSDKEAVEDGETDVDFDRVAYVTDGGSITDASNTAGGNSLIIATGTISGPQELQGNQTLQGGGSTINVRGQSSGATTSFTAPGSRPTLDAPGNDPANLTLLGSNTHVAGLDIEGAGPGFSNEGIVGVPSLDNIVIEKTTVANTSDDAISFGDDNSNVTIRDVTITDAGGHGINFSTGNSDITIVDVDITDTDDHGINFNSDNADITISDVAITRAGSHGINFNADNANVTIAETSIAGASSGINFGTGNSDVTIADTTIADVSFTGIAFGGDSSNVRIADTEVTRVGDRGISLGSVNSGITITGTTITDAANDGIFFANENRDVDITDTTVTRVGGNGITFVNLNSEVTISGNSISDAGAHGIVLGGGNSEVAISDTTITDVNGNGIFLDNVNEVTIDNVSLAGAFGGDGINMFGGGNTLNGAGNTAADATFGAGDLCQDEGNAWTGTIEFDGTDITAANCP